MVRWLGPIAAALDAATEPVPVFFRDDDAGWRDDRLRALLERFEAHGLPLDVAAIPQALGPGMARELLARDVAVHQHGLAHVNHERRGRKHEFGPSRARERQRRDIEAGRRMLAERLGERVEPIFTPPWNRCTADTGVCLAELGFAVLSRESRAEPLGIPGLRELSVSLDWCRLAAGEFTRRFAAATAPVGVMFHHAEMDDDDMDRAGELVDLVARHDRAVALPMMSLVSRSESTDPHGAEASTGHRWIPATGSRGP
jgi:Polysaccharide deacetylase